MGAIDAVVSAFAGDLGVVSGVSGLAGADEAGSAAGAEFTGLGTVDVIVPLPSKFALGNSGFAKIAGNPGFNAESRGEVATEALCPSAASVAVDVAPRSATVDELAFAAEGAIVLFRFDLSATGVAAVVVAAVSGSGLGLGI